VRSTLAWMLIVLAGVVVFSWQRLEIVHLRAQVASQQAALGDVQLRVADLSGKPPSRESWLRRADGYSAELRSDERNVILGQYQDVVAKMDLPPATASRLQDLLTDRIEAVLDAEDAATRQGFAKGSAAMSTAVGSAIADLDREISGLLGPEGSRRLGELSAGGSPELAAIAAPPVVVNLVVQSPVTPVYEDQPAPSDTAYDYNPPALGYAYSYYPFATVFAGRTFRRPFGAERPLASVRPEAGRTERGEFRGEASRQPVRPR
jgi:hypothetical protein